ncbi:MAG: DUF362 domain-containing protein [Myxococcota bacterium]|nr:DUF362 domain-containing protein [Myxococcota bacterium]
MVHQTKPRYCNKPCDKQGKECFEIDRRGFIRVAGVTLAGMSLSPMLTGCDENPHELPELDPLTDTATVGITRKDSIEEMVRTAIDLAGGLDEIKHGDSVVVKPNITGPDFLFPARVYTHPEVLRAVIKVVKEKTDSRCITIAEASGYRMPTKWWAADTGILDMAQEEGVNFLAWENDPYRVVTSNAFEHIHYKFRMPLSLFDGSFDHFINVPILKNHESIIGSNTDFTCCLKSIVGVLHPIDRLIAGEGLTDDEADEILSEMSISEYASEFGPGTRRPGPTTGIHKANLGEIIAEMNLAIPKMAMNVVDAVSIILTGGPADATMDTADPGLVLASKDRVACDALAVAVLKRYAKQQGIDRPYVDKSVWQQAQIKHAQKFNLGRTKENIVIADDNVDNIDAILAEWA